MVQLRLGTLIMGLLEGSPTADAIHGHDNHAFQEPGISYPAVSPERRLKTLVIAPMVRPTLSLKFQMSSFGIQLYFDSSVGPKILVSSFMKSRLPYDCSCSDLAR